MNGSLPILHGDNAKQSAVKDVLKSSLSLMNFPRPLIRLCTREQRNYQNR